MKPGNLFARAKMWEQYLKKKEILRKGPTSLEKWMLGSVLQKSFPKIFIKFTEKYMC